MEMRNLDVGTGPPDFQIACQLAWMREEAR
jgi:hypothetical protein